MFGTYASSTWAGDIDAASCSGADVQTAIDSANPGDTVHVPAGTCSWSSGVSFSGIELVGQGSTSGGTEISDGMVTLTKHAQAITRLSGFSFTGTDPHIEAGGSASGKPYVIDSNYVRSDVSGNEARAVHLSANGGILHHNEFEAVDWTNADVFNTQTSEDWTDPATFGTDDTTGERNIYFEDNTFTSIVETMPDGDVGSRLVIRHNHYIDSSIVFHGGQPNDSSPGGGTRQFEVYDNEFERVSNSIPLNKWVWARGSTGVIANNVMAKADSPDGSTYPNKPEILLTVGCPNPYPMQYQIGQSSQTPEDPPTHPLAIFGNTGPGTTDSNFIAVAGSMTAGPPCATPDAYIQEGRDYVLSNTWGWTPYPYPHPLAGGTGTGGTGGTGGTSGTGGSSGGGGASGGATGGTGGSAGSGASSAANGSSDDGGCSCHLAGEPHDAPDRGAMWIALMAVLFARPRTRRSILR